MFGAIFGSRAYAYEIYVQVDGRWRLDKRLEGQAGLTQLGNEQLEKSAIAQANALLNMGDFSAVKVVRTRSRSDGFTTQSEIFNKTATARPKAMTVRPFKGVFPVCDTFYDLARRPAARGFSVVFREFLDKQNATSIELLHSLQHQRKLNDMNNFLRAGIYALAGAQTQQGLPGQGERSKKLEALFDKLIQHTRDAMAEKGLPAFENNDFAKLYDRLAARDLSDDNRRFLFFFQMTKVTQTANSYAARLDMVLTDMIERSNSNVAGLLDEVAASCLDSTTLIQELLGPRSSLSDALVALADLSAGKLAMPAKPDPTLEKLNRLLGEKRLPLCEGTLWERILTNLSSKTLLSKHDPKKEWQLTRNLNHKLLSLAPESYKAAIDHAGRMRMERVRNMEN
ncbi:hypothetical protein [uncultured Ferrovibrio sp.]|jgi:hypothetical protein|uniref:hypothetical protein n=1 Tax=uncultured Ferrovibrio sp. TaxID=1576913 RepID=UPI00262F5DB4|nr:hypothetical protein [uncultured Ferrovibrio sp.]